MATEQAIPPQTQAEMRTEPTVTPEMPAITSDLNQIQKALTQIQTELHSHRNFAIKKQKRIENRLSDIVWFIMIFFVLDVVAQRVLAL